ncbi:MAG TPA: class I tRNA ligase family protein, partial [candidate division Zixibacteria bacterium]|nr:class I tRNA ligase family protein [candidate division Zixibacteria bacterium]
TEDFERLQFNTSIAALMELLRDYDAARIVSNEFNDYLILKSIQLAAPLIPHMAEELWEMAGHDDSIFRSAWPVYDPEAVVGETIEIAVQINGKLRDTIRVARDADQKTVEAAALAGEKVAKFTEGKTIIKVIYVPGRILNIVVKG